MARAEENWPAGAEEGAARGAPNGVMATTTTARTRPTMSPANRYRRVPTTSL